MPIPSLDLRAAYLHSQIPVVSPRRQITFSDIWYWVFHSLEVATCLIGFAIVGGFFVVVLVALFASGLWWMALLMALYFGGDLHEFMTKGKR